MRIIEDETGLQRVLAGTLDPWLGARLILRCRQLLADSPYSRGGDLLIVVEPGDSLDAIERAAGLPIATNLVDGSRWPDDEYVPSWEWCHLHHGVAEICYVLSDDGGGVVLFVPLNEDIDPTLLAIIRAFAERQDAGTSIA